MHRFIYYLALALAMFPVISVSGGMYYDLTFDLNATNTTLGYFLWETGVCGSLIYIVFMFILTIDLLHAGRSDDRLGMEARGLLGATAILWLCLVYTNLFFAPNLWFPTCSLVGSVHPNTGKGGQNFPQAASPREYTLPGSLALGGSPPR
ncbi:MAG: hypothetical protein R3E84_04065 [Pseudomonadales bacterium]